MGARAQNANPRAARQGPARDQRPGELDGRLADTHEGAQRLTAEANGELGDPVPVVIHDLRELGICRQVVASRREDATMSLALNPTGSMNAVTQGRCLLGLRVPAPGSDAPVAPRLDAPISEARRR